MNNFIKSVVASFVGVLCVIVFMCTITLIMLGSMIATADMAPSVKKGTVLRISLNGQIAERSNDNPFALLSGSSIAQTQGLNDIVRAIKIAKTNDNIAGIYLEGGVVSTDFATLEELRKAIVDFKESKKFVVAYADTYTQGAYYVASAADKVLLNPNGMLDWHGLASQPIFFTDLLKKIGVKMQVFKVGTFKSAVEPYILTEMSDANREQVQSFISDIWNGICTDVSASRKVTADSLNAYADRYTIFSDANDYVKMNLVDSLAYVDGVRDKLRSLTGRDKVRFITVADMVKTESGKNSGEGVVVYYAEGDIVDEAATNILTSTSPQIVGSKVVADLDQLANDDDVKAVVIRVNSGGGSAYASEQMWRAVQLLKKKKPVVVSMSGYAASGGYYLSCGADYIVAEPTTLTGSIGIFGLVPDASELLTDKLGLHFDVVKTNAASDFGAQGRPFNELEGAAMQAYVNRGYSQFLSRVAAGRKMKVADVDKIAQGRVWTGRQALQLKLVDKLGTLDDAIAEAASRAKLKDYNVSSFPLKEQWIEDMLEAAGKRDYLSQKVQTVLGVYYEPLVFVSNFSSQSMIQARMLYAPNLK